MIITATLSMGDCSETDERFEQFVLAELSRRHPKAAIDVSTSGGYTTVLMDGDPDQALAQEICADWWASFCESCEADHTEDSFDESDDRQDR